MGDASNFIVTSTQCPLTPCIVLFFVHLHSHFLAFVAVRSLPLFLFFSIKNCFYCERAKYSLSTFRVVSFKSISFHYYSIVSPLPILDSFDDCHQTKCIQHELNNSLEKLNELFSSDLFCSDALKKENQLKIVGANEMFIMCLSTIYISLVESQV